MNHWRYWLCAGGLLLALAVAAGSARAAPAQPIPLLAYYYIWFDTGSWDRAKTDLPQLGAYSSDDRAVMEQHVRWAKAAGIGGFIVSWKSTPTLNRRLQQLIDVAKQEQFKLVLIYQGLDFDRNPLPASRVAADLDFFAQTYAAEPVFDVFGRPAVIWSGTWKFSRDEIAQVAGPRRKSMLLLASERNEDDYRRIADLVDGDAYYWSSVNPATFPRYQGKLDDMAKAVHERGGLWIAPAASGFDARLIGGTQVVERNDGATLRAQLGAAFRSSPDAVGLISWNEFSENSYIEPSRNYGQRYLEVLAGFQQAATPAAAADLDSSMPGDVGMRPEVVAPLASLAALIAGSLGVLVWRSLRRGPGGVQPDEADTTLYEYDDAEPHAP
jgi:hypothetical protein